MPVPRWASPQRWRLTLSQAPLLSRLMQLAEALLSRITRPAARPSLVWQEGLAPLRQMLLDE